MSFYIFKNNQVANKSEMNANIYHLFEGAFLPLGGLDMAPADSTYKLGDYSGGKYFRHGHIKNIDCEILSNDLKTWYLYSEYKCYQTETSVSFDVNGSQTSKFMEVFMRGKLSGAYYSTSVANPFYMYMVFNEISTSSYLQNNYRSATDSSDSIGASNLREQYKTQTSAGFEYYAEMSEFFARISINGETYPRLTGFFFSHTDPAGFIHPAGTITVYNYSRSRFMNLVGGFYSDTAITNIKFNGSFEPGTHFQIWVEK
jgi:hypothetical protein